MSESQAAWGIERLYEDPSTRGDLIDAEAETLLGWGESQVQRLAAQEMDDEAFDEAVGQLNRLLRHMGRLAALRDSLPPEDQMQALRSIAETASRIDLTVPPETLFPFTAQEAVTNIHANVHALIALVMSGQENSGADPYEQQ
jgi:hypothetical protein